MALANPTKSGNMHTYKKYRGVPLSLTALALQIFFQTGAGYDFPNTFARAGNVFLRQTFGLDRSCRYQTVSFAGHSVPVARA